MQPTCWKQGVRGYLSCPDLEVQLQRHHSIMRLADPCMAVFFMLCCHNCGLAIMVSGMKPSNVRPAPTHCSRSSLTASIFLVRYFPGLKARRMLMREQS